jgi:hypothetical protein
MCEADRRTNVAAPAVFEDGGRYLFGILIRF